MTAQAESHYPEESGGLLLASLEGDVITVMSLYPLTNVREDARHNRIEINPLDYAKAERIASQRGLGVWGFYHTHPNAPAVPSEFDRTHFPFTNWWYPIVELRGAKAVSVRCWKLNEDRADFTEVAIERD